MKFFREHNEYFFILIPIIGILTTTFSIFSPPSSSAEKSYSETLFNDTYVHKIEIFLDNSDLNELREDAVYKTTFHASIVIDDEKINDIGFSTQGNATLTVLADREESNILSYKINFSKFHKGQTYRGLDKLILKTFIEDQSALRDHFSYWLSREMSIPSPLSSYAEVYLNGQYHGFFLAVETVDDSFLSRNNIDSKTAAIFKPEALVHDSYLRRMRLDSQPNDIEDNLEYDIRSPAFDSGGADLTFQGLRETDYPAIFNNAITKYSPAQSKQLINAILSLNKDESPEEHWNIDELCRFFAVQSFVYNNDGYMGIYAHNYFLTLVNNEIELLPWDFGQAYKPFGLTGEEPTKNATNWPIDDLLSQDVNLDNRPVWQMLMSNPTFLERYHQALQGLLSISLFDNQANKKLETTFQLIRPYLEREHNQLYDIEEVDKAYEYIKNFIHDRTISIQFQLWDILPKSNYLEQ